MYSQGSLYSPSYTDSTQCYIALPLPAYLCPPLDCKDIEQGLQLRSLGPIKVLGT